MTEIQKNPLYFAVLLIGAWLLGLAGESIYSPGMPAMAADLKTTAVLIKLTISFFILGKTISMIICSPIAEAFGRRQFILFGLFLFIAGGLICTVSSNIRFLLAGRLIQGVGCSVTILMGRSIVNDSFENRQAARVFSYIFTGNAIGIFILPILGGYMATYWGWRWIFLVLTIYGSVIFFLMWWFLPQTNAIISLGTLQPKTILNNYKTIMVNRSFWGFLLCVAFMMAGEKAYTTSSAFLLITAGLSKLAYGYLTALMWAAHLTGTLTAGWISLRFGIDRVIGLGMWLTALSGFVLLLISWAGLENLWLFSAILFFYMFGTGFIIVSAAVGVVRPFPNLIGFATAFAMVLEFAIASAISLFVSYHSATLLPIEKIIGTMGVLIFFSWFLFLYCPWKKLNCER
jgi:Bcr/CflA subfamily drug resistance transporter